MGETKSTLQPPALAQTRAQIPPVSLVIIACNEEANIERCIRSVPWAGDVVVVDSGSTDRTVAIATSLGARVFYEKWRGYRDQKIRATELAAHDWVLSLDADEALSEAASVELQNLFQSHAAWFATGRATGRAAAAAVDTDAIDGVEFPRLSHHMERWIRHGGWYPDWQLRFFNRTRAGWGAGHVHERVHATRKIRAKNPILHWPFPTLAEQIRTNNDYSSLGARDLFDRGKKFSVLKLLVKPATKFVETYLLKRGFLDGLPGFIIAVGAAYSVFLKFAKLRELQRAQKTDGVS